MSCSAGLTAYTMPRVETYLVESDTLLPLKSVGVYLTEDGFRKVLFERNELLTLRERLGVKDSIISLMKVENRILMTEYRLFRESNVLAVSAGKEVSKKYFWANAERWVWRGLVAYLIFRQLTH